MATVSTTFPVDGRVEERVRSRRRDLIELGVGYGLILMVLWSPRPLQRWLYLATVVWIAGATWVSFDGWRVMGLRVGGMLRSLWVVGAALVLAGIAVVVAAKLGTLHTPRGAGVGWSGWRVFVGAFWGYAIWSFMQQFLLQDFVLLRLLRLLPSKGWAVAVATGMFALGHVPSPILTVVTVVWGAIACVLFLRYRNVWTLGMAHAVLGICVAIVVPGRVDHNMRVGLGYLRYHPRGPVQRRNRDHSVSTQEWVMADDPMRRF